MMRFVIIGCVLALPGSYLGQGCCSGGSGSPIAGGTSQGVLAERQVELSVNEQYSKTSMFLSGDRETPRLFEELSSNYLYGRLAYGLSDRLTVSLESGYYLHRTQYELDRSDTIRSGGIADLIVFPRYSVLIRNTERTKTEITIGLGMKIPLGKYNDSTVIYRNPVSGAQFYTTAPPTVQPTNGANDFIFYGFVYRGYNETNFRIFTSLLYLKRGWNGLGQKFGDIASVGLFAGQSIGRRLSCTLQIRGELIAPMQYDRNVDMLALYNIDVFSTGSRKIFISPQLGYSLGSFNFYAMYETPLYQYLNGTQVGSQHMITAGAAYRFFVKD